MSAAHKKECPVAAGQVVKSIFIRAADFIVSITHSASFCWPGLLMLAQSLLIALVGLGVLQ